MTMLFPITCCVLRLKLLQMLTRVPWRRKRRRKTAVVAAEYWVLCSLFFIWQIVYLCSARLMWWLRLCVCWQVYCGLNVRQCTTRVCASTCWTTITGSITSCCPYTCRRTCFVFSFSSESRSPIGTITERRGPEKPCFSTMCLYTRVYATRSLPTAMSHPTATSWKLVRHHLHHHHHHHHYHSTV